MPSRLAASGMLPLLALAATALWAQTTIGEYDVKAALLYNFTRFIEWPGDDSREFRICIAGRDASGVDLNILATRTVQARPIRVERRSGDIRNCQIVFVPAGAPLPQPAAGVLMVAEEPSALNRGAAIALGLEDGQVVFDINQEALSRANLVASYKLLRLARPLRPAR